LREVITLTKENSITPKDAAKLLENSMREAYLTGLEMIQTFAFGEYEDVESALDISEEKAGLVLGSLLSHTKNIFEYASDSMGLTTKEVMRGYSYYFYANVLPDMEAMFKEAGDLAKELKEEDDGSG
jgi:hypothetical protein